MVAEIPCWIDGCTLCESVRLNAKTIPARASSEASIAKTVFDIFPPHAIGRRKFIVNRWLRTNKPGHTRDLLTQAELNGNRSRTPTCPVLPDAMIDHLAFRASHSFRRTSAHGGDELAMNGIQTALAEKRMQNGKTLFAQGTRLHRLLQWLFVSRMNSENWAWRFLQDLLCGRTANGVQQTMSAGCGHYDEIGGL